MHRSPARNPNVPGVLRDAAWLPHRYDPGHDAVHFVHAPRDAQRRATFLSDEYLQDTDQPLVIRRDEAMAGAAPPAPAHFIFHSAFCCSTMLARAFDQPGLAMGLKEPYILHDIVGWRRRGGAPAEVARALDDALKLLARPFRPGESVVIKPSNVANGFMPVIMAMRPAARALLLHAPLPVYLGSIARKGMVGRLWVRTLLTTLAREGEVAPLGLDVEALLGLTDLQAAAVGWLVQQRQFAALAARHPDRVRILDSETLTARPAAAIAALARLFAIPLDEPAATAIVDGPAFNRHSKTGAKFDAADRQAERLDGARLHAEEVERVLVWADKVVENAELPTLAGPLLLP